MIKGRVRLILKSNAFYVPADITPGSAYKPTHGVNPLYILFLFHIFGQYLSLSIVLINSSILS